METWTIKKKPHGNHPNWKLLGNFLEIKIFGIEQYSVLRKI